MIQTYLTLNESATSQELKELAGLIERWCEELEIEESWYAEVGQGLEDLQAGEIPNPWVVQMVKTLREDEEILKACGFTEPVVNWEMYRQMFLKQGIAKNWDEAMALSNWHGLQKVLAKHWPSSREVIITIETPAETGIDEVRQSLGDLLTKTKPGLIVSHRLEESDTSDEFLEQEFD